MSSGFCSNLVSPPWPSRRVPNHAADHDSVESGRTRRKTPVEPQRVDNAGLDLRMAHLMGFQAPGVFNQYAEVLPTFDCRHTSADWSLAVRQVRSLLLTGRLDSVGCFPAAARLTPARR